MTKIESSIGSSNLRGGEASRRFSVSDESENKEQRGFSGPSSGFNTPQERLAAAARAQTHNVPKNQTFDPSYASQLRSQANQHSEAEEHRATQDARRRIDILTGLGRRTREVPIDLNGRFVTITLRTLKTFEQSLLAQVVENAQRVVIDERITMFSPTSAHQIRLEALTHSLFLIDGQDVDIVLGTINEDYESQFRARQLLLSEMDGALTEHLYRNYQQLAQDTQDGYAPKTSEEVKEVVDAMKKSGQDT